MLNVVYPFGSQTVTLAANEKLAVYSAGTAQIQQLLSFPNYPNAIANVSSVTNGQLVTAAYASGATLIINAGAAPVNYEIGSAPQVQNLYSNKVQPTPASLDATGTLTAAQILTGIVTSSTAAAVSGTLPTGALIEAASDFAADDSFDWAVINTGPNTFTILVGTNHTIVGGAAVATATSGRFRTRKVSDSTFVTYRIA